MLQCIFKKMGRPFLIKKPLKYLGAMDDNYILYSDEEVGGGGVKREGSFI